MKIEITPASNPVVADTWTPVCVSLRTDDDVCQTPRDYLFLIDRSGSMRDGEKLAYTKEAMKKMVRRLRADTVQILVYNDVVTNIATMDRNSIESTIESISAFGETNIYSALYAASLLAKPGLHIVLFSDGHATKGPNTSLQMESIVGKFFPSNHVDTIGIGEGFDRSLLECIANKTGGRLYFVERASDIDAIVSAVITRKVFMEKAKLVFSPPAIWQENEIDVGPLEYGDTYTFLTWIKLDAVANLVVHLDEMVATVDMTVCAAGQVGEIHHEVQHLLDLRDAAERDHEIGVYIDAGDTESAIQLLLLHLEHLQRQPGMKNTMSRAERTMLELRTFGASSLARQQSQHSECLNRQSSSNYVKVYDDLLPRQN
jgi:hypothetical protein